MTSSTRSRRSPAEPASPSARAPATRNAPQQVRIIGGAFKRSGLQVPQWPGLRPTPNRVRETLFNWLGQDLSGWRVLDAFAGTGALGLEAASRGAAQVMMLEREGRLVRSIQANAAKLGASAVTVQTTDAMSWMARSAQQHPAGGFDLVFLDPPFEADLFDQALALASQCVPQGGWIYLESNRPIEPVPGLRLHRKDKAGVVHFHLFERVPLQP
ncbi:MAG TPA: 16S rRNA (guanine(966)-N(2))-methyltransferase RsmD [Aquabacterium sp.]|nr:16S rRNA (guanine(966)-N(2))-methyltransferase RsmD [Aquabacterium sp.]HRH29384.1 16S rRNA (guanine(966)-N(2))-methyltransferase RsmD [Aquabacterium sp.]